MVPVAPIITGITFVYYYYYDHYYYYYYYHQVSHFSASAWKHTPILGCVINRIRLDGLIYHLKSFLQLNMFQELQIIIIIIIIIMKDVLD
jgi:hypothetical protein